MKCAVVWLGLLCIAAMAASSTASAQCAGTMSAADASSYENVGLYQWDESLQAWVLLEARFVPSYEEQLASSWDYVVSSETLYSADPGNGSGGTVQPYKHRQGGKNQIDASCSTEDPVNLPKVTATGRRPSFFDAVITLVWRGRMLSNTTRGGGAQRAVASIGVRAKCNPGDNTEGRELAAWLAYKMHFGLNVLSVASRDTGKSYKVTFSNGSHGIYDRTSNPDGRASHGLTERIAPVGCGGT